MANISDSRLSASIIARLVTAYSTNRFIQAKRASHGGSAETAAATAASSLISETYTASNKSCRVGKFRYRVPIPTPARRAMSSSEASAPFSANATRAAAINASKLRRASARTGRRTPTGNSVTGNSAMEISLTTKLTEHTCQPEAPLR